jgi:hypothetical protein
LPARVDSADQVVLGIPNVDDPGGVDSHANGLAELGAAACPVQVALGAARENGCETVVRTELADAVIEQVDDEDLAEPVQRDAIELIEGRSLGSGAWPGRDVAAGGDLSNPASLAGVCVGHEDVAGAIYRKCERKVK